MPLSAGRCRLSVSTGAKSRSASAVNRGGVYCGLCGPFPPPSLRRMLSTAWRGAGGVTFTARTGDSGNSVTDEPLVTCYRVSYFFELPELPGVFSSKFKREIKSRIPSHVARVELPLLPLFSPRRGNWDHSRRYVSSPLVFSLSSFRSSPYLCHFEPSRLTFPCLSPDSAAISPGVAALASRASRIAARWLETRVSPASPVMVQVQASLIEGDSLLDLDEIAPAAV